MNVENLRNERMKQETTNEKLPSPELSQPTKVGEARVVVAGMFRLLATFLTVFSLGSVASAMQMVADNERLNRQCLKDEPGSNSETAADGVRVSGASTYERSLLNRAVAKMDSLSSGGKFRRLHGLSIVFQEALDRPFCLPSSQARGFVEIGRHCPAGTGMNYNFVKDSGTGLLVHEIGHHVGNAGKGYVGYPGGCHVTGYCTHSSSGEAHSYNQQLHEEFAEVFAAYVLNPGLIRHTPGCGPALHHMHALFGGRTPGLTCETNNLPTHPLPASPPLKVPPVIVLPPVPVTRPMVIPAHPLPGPTALPPHPAQRPVGPGVEAPTAPPHTTVSDRSDDLWEMPRAPARTAQ